MPPLHLGTLMESSRGGFETRPYMMCMCNPLDNVAF